MADPNESFESDHAAHEGQEQTGLQRQGSDMSLGSEETTEDVQKLMFKKKYGNISMNKSSTHHIKHGGRKYFDSADKKVDAAVPASGGVEAAAAAPKKKPTQRTNMLLVEDVKISQRVARVALTRARFKVDMANDGEDAVDKFTKGNYDIVLMDIQLPKMDGVEATKVIRRLEQEENRDRAVIFALSGAISDEDQVRYKEAGMDGCIAKGNVLVKAVGEALEEYERDPAKFVVRVDLGQ